MEKLQLIDEFITNLLYQIGWFGPVLACLLILVESIIPILPLSVFITINFYYFGAFPGFLISWIITVIGCYISFSLFRGKVKRKFDNFINKKNAKKIKHWMYILNKLKLEKLVVLLAIPFTPAFLVNIAAGLSNINREKYLTALIIGKTFLVYFWGFIGTSLIESLKEPQILIKTVVIILLAFLLSKIINKRYHIE